MLHQRAEERVPRRRVRARARRRRRRRQRGDERVHLAQRRAAAAPAVRALLAQRRDGPPEREHVRGRRVAHCAQLRGVEPVAPPDQRAPRVREVLLRRARPCPAPRGSLAGHLRRGARARAPGFRGAGERGSARVDRDVKVRKDPLLAGPDLPGGGAARVLVSCSRRARAAAVGGRAEQGGTAREGG